MSTTSTAARPGHVDVLDGHADDAPAVLLAKPPPRVVDEDPAHQSGGDRKKMRAVLPVDAALVDELEVGLVDERRGLECAVPALTSPMTGGNDVQFVVHERYETVERLAAAPLPVAQELSDFCGRVR